ncbi:MAG: hypothetical protein QF619_08925, partial [Candidatus Binatia bacterium]|nr:hypothetical protein [Candidatus Binatia bacterium]
CFTSMMTEVKRELTGQDLVSTEILFRRSIDFHYRGQTHEITTPLDCEGDVVTDKNLQQCIACYHELHERLHTFSNPEQPVELMVLRLEGLGLTWKPQLPMSEYAGKDPSGALKGQRKVYFEDLGGFQETPTYDGDRIQYGNVLVGPCIIEESTTTIVVHRGQQATLTQLGNYEINTGN